MYIGWNRLCTRSPEILLCVKCNISSDLIFMKTIHNNADSLDDKNIENSKHFGLTQNEQLSIDICHAFLTREDEILKNLEIFEKI